VIAKACFYFKNDFEEVIVRTTYKAINLWDGDYEAHKMLLCEKLTPACKNVNAAKFNRDPEFKKINEEN
jgi:hypothetical protein